MNFYLLGAIVLFSLTVPLVMQYRILPIEGTPYWLFGILFVILTANVALASALGERFRSNLRGKLHVIFTWVTIGIVLVGVMVTAISDRHKTAPVFGAHDIILQQEAAMRYLLEGKNPYSETYFGTPMEAWYYDELGKPAVNPALYHFVMPPWYVMFPFSIYFITTPTLGYFDGRMALLVCMLGLLFVLSRWFKNSGLRLLAITLTALSPAVFHYFIEGRSDIFALFWFILSLFLLERKRVFFSTIIFAIALLSKQTIWFAVPFYGVALWIQTKKSLPKFSFLVVSMLVVVVLVAGPFVLWNPRAYIASTIFYLSGTTEHSYPISGYGLGMMLYDFGLIRDIHDQYPFIVWQVLFGLPVLGMSLIHLYEKPTMSRFLFGYAFTLFVWWYMSRYFNNSHIGVISSLLVLAGLKELDEKRV